jgi:F0F1-type ATP synthase assembly protein I
MLESIVNIILSVTFISVFIGIFFFTYAKNIEEEVIQTQSGYIATSIANDVKMFIPSQFARKLADNIQEPDMSKEDEEVENKNTELKNKAYKILSIFVVIGILSSYIISRYIKINFWHAIKINLIILFFAGITEFLFLNLIGKNFISADPNFVRYKVLQVVKDKFDIKEPVNLDNYFSEHSKITEIKPNPTPIV